jgi:hypothetical protein
VNGALDIHPKVVAATGGGTLGILILWLLGLAHVTVDPIVAGALTAAVASFLGWLAPVVKAEVPVAE